MLKINNINLSDESNLMNSSIPLERISNLNANPFGQDPLNINMNSPTWSQVLKTHLYRNLLLLYRTKWVFVSEWISSTIVVYIFLFTTKFLFHYIGSEYQDLDYLLNSGNTIYYKFNNQFNETSKFNESDFLNSYYIKDKLKNEVKLEKISYNITKDDTIEEIDELMWLNHPYQNEKSVLYFKTDETDLTIYALYQMSSSDYFQATMNMFLSAYFNKQFGINITFIQEYSSLPKKTDATAIDIQSYLLSSFDIIVILLGIISITEYLLSTPLKERIYKMKKLIYLSDTNMHSYWISLYISDIIKFLIFLLLVVPFYLILDSKFAYQIPSFLLFIFPMLSFIYCFSYGPGKLEVRQNFYLFFIFMSTLFLFSLSIMYRGFLKVFLSNEFIFELEFLPITSLILGLFRVNAYSKYPQMFLEVKNLYEIIFANLGYWWALFVIYTVILYLLEFKIIGIAYNWISYHLCLNEKEIKKKDIKKEIDNLENDLLLPKNDRDIENELKSQNFSLISENNNNVTTFECKNVRKTYYVSSGQNVRAVNNFSFILKSNENLGLLGFNGSGKTTIFEMMTNSLFFDSGSLKLFDKNVGLGFNSIRGKIGYCPQMNVLFDYLTVKEIVEYYCTLKGIDMKVDYLLIKYGLNNFRDIFCWNLSNGNKRKLIFALALMNKPSLLLLDEPSTSVDLESRRLMWKNLKDFREEVKDSNIIICTHSFKEADVLCDKVLWLKSRSYKYFSKSYGLKLLEVKKYYFNVKFENKFVENEQVNPNENDIISELSEKVGGKEILTNFYETEGKKKIMWIKYQELSIFYESVKTHFDSMWISAINKDYSFELEIEAKESNQIKLYMDILNASHSNQEWLIDCSISIKSFSKDLMGIDE